MSIYEGLVQRRAFFPISPFLVPLILAMIVTVLSTPFGADPIATFLFTFLLLMLVVGLPLLLSGLAILPEYERAAVLRLGRYKGMLGPGVVIRDPILDRIQRFDLRIQTIDIPQQEVLTKDNVSIKIDTVLIYRIYDPGRAFITLKNIEQVLFQYGQAIMREVIGIHELDEIIQKREELAKVIQQEVDKLVGEWGIKVISVALQNMLIPDTMIRAMAMQAEAERERRAKIISAEGELRAAQIMAEAASYYANNPHALRLRELTTLVEISREKNVIVLYPTTFGQLEQTLAAAVALKKATESGK
ncbi:MAG: SPFH domain-containing protein [Crenarchaeota archaeon]|nr:SPFH domain-containing protein [Thermoproteota archaeon]MCR8455409.1 SPFH domain-containing protein [Thermoproteota archaeon]MCR8501072.1 SPFH domain-containing protein [Thermoproteota archaeon]